MRALSGLVLFTLFFAACAPNRDEPCRAVHIDTIPLDASLNSLMPYKHGDTISFRNNGGDIIKVEVTYDWFYPIEKIPVNVNPECPSDTLVYDGIGVNVSPSNVMSYFLAPDYDISAKNRSLTLYFDPIGIEFSEQELLTGNPFVDSMEIQNNIYTRVFRATYNTLWNNDTVYFNREFGFIKIVKDTNTWELIR